MQYTFLKQRRLIAIIAISFVCALTALVLLAQRPVAAAGDSERVVTVFDGATEQTFVTTASTVKEALQRGNISITDYDAVEPLADTELVARNYNINVYRARPVVVVDGTQRVHIMSPHKSARQVADKAGITLHAEDVVQTERIDDVLSEGVAAEKITVDRAVPFTLTLYGKKSDVRTQAATVGDYIKEKNITLGPKDQASLPLTQVISAGMTLEIWRDGKSTITEEQEVAFPIRQIQDKDREVGYKQVQTPGVAGKKTVTYEIEMKNGKEVGRAEIQSVVTLEPKEQVEVVGAKPKNVFSGGLGEAMARLRACESGGNYENKRNSLYRGAYQFGYQTWANHGGFYDPADAPPSVQDEAALMLYNRRGWQPWPHCSQKLGLQDIYR